MKGDKLNQIILETNKLFLRKIEAKDVTLLFPLLSDPDVMRFYPKTLNRRETREWTERILRSYAKYGISWWAVYHKENQDFIGQVGIIVQTVEDEDKVGLSYMIHKKYWRQGYTTEAASAVLHYGFVTLKLNRIICLVRPSNTPSNGVARKLGFHIEATVNYKGYEHHLYILTKEDYHKLYKKKEEYRK